MKNTIKDLKFKLNMKSIMLFEQLTGKSFYKITDTDLEDLVYSIITVNNPELRLTETQLEMVLSNNQKMASEILSDLQEELKYMEGLVNRGIQEPETEKAETEEPGEVPMISDILSILIVQFNLDPHYVLFEMSIWEIAVYSKAIEDMKKEEMTEKRFWTYLSMLPHIDGKKIGGPEKLLPFPWEKNKKDEAAEFMEKNRKSIADFFKKQEEKDE